jgi:hypothetical protein
MDSTERECTREARVSTADRPEHDAPGQGTLPTHAVTAAHLFSVYAECGVIAAPHHWKGRNHKQVIVEGGPQGDHTRSQQHTPQQARTLPHSHTKGHTSTCAHTTTALKQPHARPHARTHTTHTTHTHACTRAATTTRTHAHAHHARTHTHACTRAAPFEPSGSLTQQ